MLSLQIPSFLPLSHIRSLVVSVPFLQSLLIFYSPHRSKLTPVIIQAGKVKVFLVNTTKAYETVEVKLHAFHSFGINGGQWFQLHAPVVCPRRQNARYALKRRLRGLQIRFGRLASIRNRTTIPPAGQPVASSLHRMINPSHGETRADERSYS